MIKAAEPMLPYYPVRVLLPFGETMDSASISITDNYVAAQGIDIEHANVQQPISLSQTAEITGANPEIYLRDAFILQKTGTIWELNITVDMQLPCSTSIPSNTIQ